MSNATPTLGPNQSLDAFSLALPIRALEPEKVVSGEARVGLAELAELGETGIGLWEMSPSVSTDVEVDEVFLVLTGEATVRFADGSPALELRPGSLVRLAAGAQTVWDVRQTLRKLYIA